MDEKRKSNLIRNIYRRTDFAEPVIYVSDFIEKICGMGMYTNMCLKRISKKIDGEHIGSHFENFPDISLDCTGMKECHDIFSSYVDSEDLSKYERILDAESSIAESMNEILGALRLFKKKDMKEIIARIEKTGGDEPTIERIELMKHELKARGIKNRIKTFAEEKCTKIYIHFKYGKYFKEIFGSKEETSGN